MKSKPITPEGLKTLELMEKAQGFHEVLLYRPRGTEYEILRPWYIANCVFNAFLTITTIFSNGITIQALRRTSSLPQSLKTLLLSLAVSDLGVGLLGEPFYLGILVRWLQQGITTGASFTAFRFIFYLFATASFSGVMALTVDRFLAVYLHLRYQELVTHKRVVAVVISIWVLSAFLSLLNLWVPKNISYIMFAITGITWLIVSVMCYLKIYFAVRRHRNEIQALQVAQNDQIANADRLRKSAVGVFYVYLVFLFCYLPQFCNFAVVAIFNLSAGVKVFAISSITLLLLNSSLNPVIYCWKMRHIRRAVMGILRNVLSIHS